MSDTKEFETAKEALSAILSSSTTVRQSFNTARAVIFLLKQQIDASKKVEGWRSIETVPRDSETEFLAASIHDGFVQYWIARASADTVFETFELMTIYPTYWMPITPPPQS